MPAPRLILLGPPGAGKGTQAKRLAERWNWRHIATGDLFRDAVRKESPLGKQVKPILEAGGLVSNELVVGLVRETLAEEIGADRGIIFDGFPRTLPQAIALDEFLMQYNQSITTVVLINTGDDIVVHRVAQRRSCEDCGAIFNLMHKPPARPGRCDACGGKLYQRADDREATVRARQRKYWSETAPLIEFYRTRGLLTEIPGDLPLDVVTASVERAVSGRR
ncbi:MAG: adenylate kinase [Planctomycetota bacterium]|nr:adenylate kinase [Planctomycetota bacterium]